MREGGGPHLPGMHPPIVVREPSGAERAQLEASPRAPAPSAFTVRRALVGLVGAGGHRPRAFGRGLCGAAQTVRNGIRARSTPPASRP